MGECFERFKLGALLGGTVGSLMGIFHGTYHLLRYVPKQTFSYTHYSFVNLSNWSQDTAVEGLE